MVRIKNPPHPIHFVKASWWLGGWHPGNPHTSSRAANASTGGLAVSIDAESALRGVRGGRVAMERRTTGGVSAEARVACCSRGSDLRVLGRKGGRVKNVW